MKTFKDLVVYAPMLLGTVLGLGGAKLYERQMTKDMQPNSGAITWVDKDSVDLSNPSTREVSGKGYIQIAGTVADPAGDREYNQTINPGEQFPTNAVFKGEPSVKVESDDYCGCPIAQGAAAAGALGSLGLAFALRNKKAA